MKRNKASAGHQQPQPVAQKALVLEDPKLGQNVASSK